MSDLHDERFVEMIEDLDVRLDGERGRDQGGVMKTDAINGCIKLVAAGQVLHMPESRVAPVRDARAELSALETALAAKDKTIEWASGELLAIGFTRNESTRFEQISDRLLAAISPPTGKVLVDVEHLRKIRYALRGMWDNPESITPSDMLTQYTAACEMLDEAIDV